MDENEEYTVVSVRLTKQLKSQISDTANDEHRSLSAQILRDLSYLYESK